MGLFLRQSTEQELGVAVGTSIPWHSKTGHFIFVNKYGKRFMKETKSIYHYKGPLDVFLFDHERAEYPNVPAYLIFDDVHRKSGPISRKPPDPVGYEIVHKVHDWSNDNALEIDKGWIIKADTLADLAGKINVERAGLEETIKQFNSYAAAGKDGAFNRSRDSMAPIQTPPYYALELGLVLVNTQGGPKHNRYGQVLDPDDKPIPRLYAAGELGSFFGFLYQVGTNYPEAWAFGRIAGMRAASEKPFHG